MITLIKSESWHKTQQNNFRKQDCFSILLEQPCSQYTH
jgi:hypothetical protein